MFYELWDTDSRNLIGDYDTQEDALRIVRNALEAYGESAVMALALGMEDENGETTAIAHGEALIELARRLPVGAD